MGTLSLTVLILTLLSQSMELHMMSMNSMILLSDDSNMYLFLTRKIHLDVLILKTLKWVDLMSIQSLKNAILSIL